MISKKGFIDFIDKKDVVVGATSFAIGIAAADFLKKIVDIVIEPIQKNMKRSKTNGKLLIS